MLSNVKAVDGQLQLSSYLDSNVRETVSASDPTIGLVLRGRLGHSLHRPRSSIFGEFSGQTNLDPLFREETKLIVTGDLGASYALSEAVRIQGQLGHFSKSFYDRTGSYRWNDYRLQLEFSPEPRYSAWWIYLERNKTLELTNRYRFVERSWELRGRYQPGRRILIEGSVGKAAIVHRDIFAVRIPGDTASMPLLIPQEDTGWEGSFHLRYISKIIIGTRLGRANFRSNSVIGAYELSSYQVYLSGQVGESVYYHASFRRVKKDYSYPSTLGDSSPYRDPEEPDQDLAHFRLEKVMGDRLVGYFQVSRLRNETVLNQHYYAKTLLETGIKYRF